MKTVPVVEMKAHFSALLAEVANGEEVAITRHGRIIARLVCEKPRLAADIFRPFWNDNGDGHDIDLVAPEDTAAEPVVAMA